MGTGVLRLLGGEVENRYVRRGPTSYSIIGEAMFRPQSASEHAIPTSRQNVLQIQYLDLLTGCILLRMRVPPDLDFPPKYLKLATDCAV